MWFRRRKFIASICIVHLSFSRFHKIPAFRPDFVPTVKTNPERIVTGYRPTHTPLRKKNCVPRIIVFQEHLKKKKDAEQLEISVCFRLLTFDRKNMKSKCNSWQRHIGLFFWKASSFVYVNKNDFETCLVRSPYTHVVCTNRIYRQILPTFFPNDRSYCSGFEYVHDKTEFVYTLQTYINWNYPFT